MKKITDKDTEKIKKYLKSKSALLVTESPTDRTAWKKLFAELGVQLNNFHNASTMHDAHELINTKRVDILFTSHKLGEQYTYELLENHMGKYPDRSDYFCYFVSDKNSLALTALVAEMEVDSLILKPYNQKDLIDSVKKSMLDSVNMSKELRTFHHILGQLRDKKFDDALVGAEEYVEKLPNSPNGYYLKGLSKKNLGESETAIDIWKNGLEKDLSHYQLMCALFDTYCEQREFDQSYKLGETLTSSYPINPSRIPNLIRSALATQNHLGLIKFCEMVLSLDESMESIKKPIAAALTLSGKSLINREDEDHSELIVNISKKAINLTEKQSKIHAACLENLFNLGQFDEVKTLLANIPSDEMSVDFISLELLVFEQTEDKSQVFVMAQKLVRENKVTSDIFKALLRCGKTIGKSKGQLEDIVFEGAKIFPDDKGHFESILT